MTYNYNIVNYHNERKSLNKVQIRETLETYSNYDFEGSLNELIEKLITIRDNALPGQVEIIDDSSLDEDCEVNLYFNITREETDAEYEQRMILVAKDALADVEADIKKEADEKELFAKLKLKYEKAV